MKTTGIGSLPHHNVDSAIDYAFRHDLPFLPQLPLKNPKEMMIYQTMFGFPGLVLDGKKVTLRLKDYVHGRPQMLLKLYEAQKKLDYAAFIPTPEEYSAYSAFMFELAERKCTEAKVQITGHLTSSQVITLDDGESLQSYEQILNDIYQWTCAKAMALVQSLKEKSITPTIFIDEPILALVPTTNPRWPLWLSEFELLVLSLKKMGSKVGLHSCGNSEWGQLLKTSIDYLSFDAELSGDKILQQHEALLSFMKRGGRLAIGILPTDLFDHSLNSFKPQFERWTDYGGLITCACGLGFKTPEQTELFLSQLAQVKGT